MEIVFNAVRIHGGFGLVDRARRGTLVPRAPLMVVGKGANGIQKSMIAAQLGERGRLDY